MDVVERFGSFRYHLTRSILSSWISPTVLGCDPGKLGIDPEDPVCYVMPYRSLADLMVIDRACEDCGLPRPMDPIHSLGEKRSFFFLGHPEGRFGRKTQRHHSERMQRLFQSAGADDLRIIPVSLFWGHQPDREKSILKLILSENWSATSRFKKLLAIIFHPNHILVQFGSPISIHTIRENEPDIGRQIRKLHRILRVHFNHQRQAIIGPDLSHRRTLINTMLESPNVQHAIAREAADKRISTTEARTRALEIANEIASHQSYRVVRFFHVILSWLWNNLYDGIEVNGIDSVKRMAQSHEIVYTPCHRSHIDYLLLSYVLYHNGLAPPHIAAGINLNLPVVGSLLRRAGAFFMRRSFHGDDLYKAVFDEYLHLMFTRGYSVEYFIEGGRSRTGRTLKPRTGMLGMTVRSFQRDSSLPICMMPVYFGYERVLESSTYRSELSGETKKNESLFDIFRIFNFFKFSFGIVSVNFGEPLLLGEFLDRKLPAWKQEPPSALHDTCQTLSLELATRINSAVSIKAVSLVATALLSTPRQTIEENHLLKQIADLKNIATALDYSEEYTVTTQSPEEILETTRTIIGLQRTELSFGTIVRATDEATILLTYYRNNVAHLFALPSLMLRFIKQEKDFGTEDIISSCSGLYPFLKAEYFLRWSEEELARRCHILLKIFGELELITLDGDIVRPAKPGSHRYASLSRLAEIVEPTLERFHIVNTLLLTRAENTMQELESVAGAMAEQLSAIYGLNSPDFFDKSLFSTYIDTLCDHDLAHLDDGLIRVSGTFRDHATLIAETLPPDVRYNVLQALPVKAPDPV